MASTHGECRLVVNIRLWWKQGQNTGLVWIWTPPLPHALLQSSPVRPAAWCPTWSESLWKLTWIPLKWQSDWCNQCTNDQCPPTSEWRWEYDSGRLLPKPRSHGGEITLLGSGWGVGRALFLKHKYSEELEVAIQGVRLLPLCCVHRTEPPTWKQARPVCMAVGRGWGVVAGVVVAAWVHLH